MSISQASDVKRVAITTARQTGGDVAKNALHLRADAFARIFTGSQIFHGDSIESKHGDGFAVFCFAGKYSTILYAYLCQNLETTSKAEDLRRRKATNKTVNV